MIDEKKIEEVANKKYFLPWVGSAKDSVEIERDAFKAGANWALQEFKKSLWHDASEEPHKYATILVVGEEERYPAGGSGVEVLLTYNLLSEYYDWEEEKEDMNIVKWLYLDDIVEEEGGEE